MPSGRVFRKRIELSDGGTRYRLERDKARAAGSVFHDRTDIVTPKLLDWNDDAGELVFEFVDALIPLDRDSPSELFQRAGIALALIHTRLELPAGAPGRGPVVAGSVFVHGDYWHGNLGTSAGKLVVLDWGVRPWTTESYAVASPSLDIASFLAPFLMPRWWDPRLRSANLRLFVRAYFSALGDREAIVRSAEASLGVELAAQRRYVAAEVRKRSPAGRLLLSGKLALNCYRLSSALNQAMGRVVS